MTMGATVVSLASATRSAVHRRGRDTAYVVESSVDVGGIPTRTLEIEGDGPPLLLLHGFTDSADSWRPLLAELHRRNRRAVAVDLPGSGAAPPMGRPAIATLAAFATAFVRTYAGGQGVVVVGNSLGGLLALEVAQDSSLPIREVVCLAPAGLAYHRRFVVLERCLRHLDPWLRVVDRLPVPASVVRGAAAAVYHHRIGRRRADVTLARRYASHLRGMKDVARMRADLLALSDDSSAEPLRVDRIRRPVLLVWGVRDQLLSVAGAPSLLAAVPDSRLVVLDDCGHCPQIERPVEVADLVCAPPRRSSALDPTT